MKKIQPKIMLRMCRMRGTPWTKHMNEAKGAEWGKKNPGQSHRNPMLEELKDKYGNEGHNQR